MLSDWDVFQTPRQQSLLTRLFDPVAGGGERQLLRFVDVDQLGDDLLVALLFDAKLVKPVDRLRLEFDRDYI